MTSNAYISDVAKKSHKKIKNIKDNKIKVFFPKFDGKIYDPTLNKALNILKLNEDDFVSKYTVADKTILLGLSTVNLYLGLPSLSFGIFIEIYFSF